MTDRYDEAVEYLTAHPTEIVEAWERPTHHPAGCLFGFCTPNRGVDIKECGCISQVRGCDEVAWTESLTERIRADMELPKSSSPYAIRVDHLPHFAKWQRIMDTEIRRLKPERAA